MSDQYEKVDQPKHYQGNNGMTVMQIIEAYECNFAVGNVIKYMLRAGNKPNEDAMDDLKKALWYLQSEIDRRTPTEKKVIGANLTAKNPNLKGFEELGRYTAASYRVQDPSFGNPNPTIKGVKEVPADIYMEDNGPRSIIDLSVFCDDED